MISKEHAHLDALLVALVQEAKLLPAITPTNAVEERERLIGAFERGEPVQPAWAFPPLRVSTSVLRRALEEARRLAERVAGAALYLARLAEIELDLDILDAVGHPRRVRPLAARRFGTGDTRVELQGAARPLRDAADEILRTTRGEDEKPSLPADAPPAEPSTCGLIRAVARAAKLDVEVRVEPRLAARAATGEHSIYVGARTFGIRESIRLAVHEVLGHMVAAENARSQPIKLLVAGTAGAFADQEGVALCLEEDAGLFDGSRLRTLAGRVVATDLVHAGASFVETVRALRGGDAFPLDQAVAMAERAHRGGGVARDAGYLRGWLRVRQAMRDGTTTIDQMRMGRLSLDALDSIRGLIAGGFLVDSRYRPSLSRSLSAASLGTSLPTSPPSFAASLTRFELT